MTRAIYLLLLLGIIAQGLMMYGFQHDLAAFRRDDAGGISWTGVLVSFAPMALAASGAAAAWTLHRRRSWWAWPIVIGPLLVLMLGFCAGAYFVAYPLPLLGGYGGLPL
ncbi:hypothetical protein [Teichococcus wenyumeiae]|uniref:hypothetical protein n=1 Tax=Teichococcus wenyumeiae TaxID=2478470 RepID=UPI0011C35C8B|nr:hypothetical protein [Pseudoroseomonas wenyumeiae]